MPYGHGAANIVLVDHRDYTDAETTSVGANTTGTEWGAAARSDSGTCFYLRASSAGATRYGTSDKAPCTAQQALAVTAPAWSEGGASTGVVLTPSSAPGTSAPPTTAAAPPSTTAGPSPTTTTPSSTTTTIDPDPTETKLTVDFPDIFNANVYVYADDGKSNTHTFTVLTGTYDIRIVRGSSSQLLDSINCTTPTCTAATTA